MLPICLRIARARPTKILRAITFPKTICISIHTNQLQAFYQFRLSVANIRDRICFVLAWSFIKGKLSVQSLVPSLSLNDLLPFVIFLSSVHLILNKNSTSPDWQTQDRSGLAKIVPLRIGKNKTPPDWQKQYPSGFTKTGPLRIGKKIPLRIGKNSTPPGWQNQDPSELANLGPLRIGKIETVPDWQN